MRTVVAVLRGGPGSEYEHSLKVGAHLLKELDQEKYEARDVFLDRAGQWHVHGAPVLPEAALRGSDVALNALYGEFGAAGGVQKVLEKLAVPYAGSRSGAASLAYHTPLTKAAARELGIPVARAMGVDAADKDISKLAYEIFRTFPLPLVVLPVGSSAEGMKADTFASLEWALERAAAQSPKILIEEYISGTDAGVGVIDNFRDEETYALIPSGGPLSTEQKKQIAELAKRAHQGLGLAHYSHADFVVSKRGIYFVGVDAHPTLAPDGRFAEALGGVGAKLGHFLDHIIGLAKNKK